MLNKEKKYTYFEAGEGTPIIILHGLMGGLSNFDGVANFFPPKGYKVVIPELPIYTQNILKTNVKAFSKFVKDFIVHKGKVIKNVFNTRENYLTVNIGEKDSVKTDMGVINDKGIIGIVEKTSKKNATVQSILNTKSRINAKIKNSNHFGSLIWDGKNVGYAQLIDVPRLSSLKKGDSIVTGAESEIFPENIPIGKIDKVYVDTKTNYYTINVRLFNDMTALGYVYIIENKHKKEKLKLETKQTDK